VEGGVGMAETSKNTATTIIRVGTVEEKMGSKKG
jgi:hypothetical protein